VLYVKIHVISKDRVEKYSDYKKGNSFFTMGSFLIVYNALLL
jgi:hypothetical protein